MTDESYAKIKYNPFDVPVGTMIWEKYKALGRRAHLSSVPVQLFQRENEVDIPTQNDLSLLVSFIILFVDQNSPFYDEVDFEERKSVVLEALHIPKTSIVWKCVSENHWWFGIVLTAYFRLANIHLFESWYSLKVHTHNQNELLRRPLDENENFRNRNEIAGKVDENNKKLIELEHRLFHDPTMKDIAVEAVTSDYFVGYAEKHALTFPIAT